MNYYPRVSPLDVSISDAKFSSLMSRMDAKFSIPKAKERLRLELLRRQRLHQRLRHELDISILVAKFSLLSIKEQRQHEVVVLSTSESTTGSDDNNNHVFLPDDILRSIISIFFSPTEYGEMALVNKQFHGATTWCSMKKLQVLLPIKDYKDIKEVFTSRMAFTVEFEEFLQMIDVFKLIGRRCIFTGEIQCLIVVLFLHKTYYSNLPAPGAGAAGIAHACWWTLNSIDLEKYRMTIEFTHNMWKDKKYRLKSQGKSILSFMDPSMYCKSQRELKTSMYFTAKDFTTQLLSIKSETKRCDYAYDNGYKIFAYWLHEKFGYEWKNSLKAAAVIEWVEEY